MPFPATLTLFAFNQEDYVRAAIAGAFAQTFVPLEIILSDDCSADRTFAIMEEMAAAYHGQHSVRARREPANVGTVQHVINVAREARGKLMVIGAGDDISYPDRVAALHDAWLKTGAVGLSSWHDEIDEHGAILKRDVSFPASKVVQDIFAHEFQAHRTDGMIQTVPGFCAAYPRAFWADLPDPPARLLVEDAVASALIIFRGQRVHRVPRSLIAYRLLNSSASVRPGGLSATEIRDRERKIEQHGRELATQLTYVIDQTRREGIAIHPRTMRWLDRARNYGEVITGFWAAGPIARLRRLTAIRSPDAARFLLPRIAGLPLFAALRAVTERARRRG